MLPPLRKGPNETDFEGPRRGVEPEDIPFAHGFKSESLLLGIMGLSGGKRVGPPLNFYKRNLRSSLRRKSASFLVKGRVEFRDPAGGGNRPPPVRPNHG